MAWKAVLGGGRISVADVTPGWHAPTRKLLAIGIKVRYSPAGEQLLDQPRSHDCAYATFDPQTNQWSQWKMLEMLQDHPRFFLLAPGCVQWLVERDGKILLPTYFKGPTGDDYSVTVLRCDFDGEKLKF